MTFDEKIKELRKNLNITQEELASKLYVSRTTVSKWESGKGYPSIDTLKSLAKIYNVSVDELISNDEIIELSIDNKKKTINLVIALLDILEILFLILPIFAKDINGVYQSVIIYNLNASLITYILYFFVIGVSIINGIATIIVMNYLERYSKYLIISSFALNVLLVALFLLTKQPYPGVIALALLVIKSVIYLKK